MAEPISLLTAKAHLRVLDTSEDALIESYIKAAREYVERYTGHILVQREVTEERPAFARFFDLQWRPFDPETVTISYTDADGVAAEVTGLTVSGQRASPAYSTWWPSTRPGTGVRITYTAGYAAGQEPQALLQAMLLLIGHWHSNREAVGTASAAEIPYAVQALCDQFRAPGL